MNKNTKRVVLITGGGSGIGKSISQAFIDAGDQVVIVQRSIAKLNGADSIQFDLSDLDNLPQLIQQVCNTHGRLDVLINNAGRMQQSSVEEMTLLDWQRTLDLNLSAPFVLIKHALPLLIESGGCIVNISSIEGQAANPLHAAYCASKSGLNGLTRAVAVDCGPRGVRCNAIAPGWIDTQFNQSFIEQQADSDKFRAGLSSIHPVGKTGEPSDIAELALWLSSEKASFVTGQVWVVDGGRMTQISLPG